LIEKIIFLTLGRTRGGVGSRVPGKRLVFKEVDVLTLWILGVHTKTLGTYTKCPARAIIITTVRLLE
jgi:hypothetical protein